MKNMEQANEENAPGVSASGGYSEQANETNALEVSPSSSESSDDSEDSTSDESSDDSEAPAASQSETTPPPSSVRPMQTLVAEAENLVQNPVPQEEIIGNIWESNMLQVENQQLLHGVDGLLQQRLGLLQQIPILQDEVVQIISI